MGEKDIQEVGAGGRKRSLNAYYNHLNAIKSYCHSYTTVLFKEENNRAHLRFHKAGCNSWDCPECRERKALRLRRRVEEASKNSSWRFATLTLSREGTTLKDSLTSLNHVWDMFLKRLRRSYNNIRIIRFVEFHKDGYPHIHFFCNTFIPQPLLRHLWNSVGGGTIVDIRLVKNETMFRYCTDYTTGKKNKHKEHDWQYYCYAIRRFNATRNYYADNLSTSYTCVIRPVKEWAADEIFLQMFAVVAPNYKNMYFLEPDEIWFYDPYDKDG